MVATNHLLNAEQIIVCVPQASKLWMKYAANFVFEAGSAICFRRAEHATAVQQSKFHDILALNWLAQIILYDGMRQLTSAHHCCTLISRGSQWRITPRIPRRRLRVRRALLPGTILCGWYRRLQRRLFCHLRQNREKNQVPRIAAVVPEGI